MRMADENRIGFLYLQRGETQRPVPRCAIVGCIEQESLAVIVDLVIDVGEPAQHHSIVVFGKHRSANRGRCVALTGISFLCGCDRWYEQATDESHERVSLHLLVAKGG